MKTTKIFDITLKTLALSTLGMWGLVIGETLKRNEIKVQWEKQFEKIMSIACDDQNV
jgi:hypothetical protein